MAWIWGGHAAIEPAFKTVTDSSDPGIRSLMKIPATLADLGIAAAAIWWFRDRPKLALLAAGAVLLWPATWYVSAWWGQYESIYVLGAVLALLAARGGLPLVTAALLAVSLMTKPQALPFLVPFGGLVPGHAGHPRDAQGRSGRRGGGRAPVATVHRGRRPGQLPQQPRDVPERRVRDPVAARRGTRGPCSRSSGANGQFVSDRTSAFGPVTFRVVGYVVAASSR